jgi:hypothetical protein
MKFHDEISQHDEVSVKVSIIIFRRSLRWLIVGSKAQGSKARRAPRSRRSLGFVFGCVLSAKRKYVLGI